MATDFVWQLSAETEKEEMTFGSYRSSRKISDAEIRAFLKLICEQHEIDIPANCIYNLTFVATDLNGNRFAETLSPFDFWPIEPLSISAENRYMFRTCKSHEKGGEE